MYNNSYNCHCCIPNYSLEYYKIEPILKKGSKGEAVKNLQISLNYYGANLTPDGDFGRRTEDAVIAFQKANSLDPDGKVGPNTRRFLDRKDSRRIEQSVLPNPVPNVIPNLDPKVDHNIFPTDEITPQQKKIIDAIVSINETGKIPSEKSYSTVAILADGAGISYGKHQATDKSGSLDKIVKKYKELSGSKKFDDYL